MLRRLILACAVTAIGAAPFAQPARAYTLGQLMSATTASADADFSSVAVAFEDAPQFRKWKDVRRAAKHGEYLRACYADARKCTSPRAREWRAMMHGVAGKDRFAQAQAVNGFFNRLTYRTDQQEFGVSDRWIRPMEFLRRGAGDCEDFAVAKFFSLKVLGVSNEDLRLVAVFDRLAGVGHAVLTVRIAGERYVLDNRSDYIFAESRYRHYEPLLSMNETGGWRNLQRQAANLGRVSGALTFR